MISPAGRNRRMRFARPLRALIVAVAFATAASGGAHAQERPSRVAAFTDFFRWQEPIPAALRSAFRAYEEGRFFTALGVLFVNAIMLSMVVVMFYFQLTEGMQNTDEEPKPQYL